MKSPEEVLLEFAHFVDHLRRRMGSTIEDRLHMAVGISGEAGELLDAIKKNWVYGKPLDTENVEEELGDLLYYIQGLANLQDVSIITLMERNMEKLKKRYPQGYTSEAAIARADKSEQS